MFHSARIKLTAWYLLIIMTVSISFSTIIYRMISIEIDRIARIQHFRFERGFADIVEPPFQIVFDETILTEERHRIIWFLIAVNAGVCIISGGLGYWLAGRTLKPISDMLDEQHRFVSDASHELRTPLTALKSAMEVHLRDPKLTLAEAKTLIKESVVDVNKLQALSDALLTLTQYASTQSPRLFTQVRISRVIEQSVKHVSLLAKQKHIHIQQQIEDGALEAHESGLTEICTILLDNAIKYSKEKTTVTIETTLSDSQLTIQVKDTGIGISKEDLPRIFDRFYRADSARSAQPSGGYGLGLAIAERISSLHHGTITAVSSQKNGTIFTVRLPLKQPNRYA